MCSYNRINGTYGCENSKAMNGLLKGELNFQGFVVSDWVAQHSGLASADAGLDMAMPDSPRYWDKDRLANAVDKGFNRTRLEDMAIRSIAAWYQFGQDGEDFPELGVGMPADITRPHEYVDAKDPTSRSSLLQQAVEGHVLVKNIRNALPLRSPKSLSVFGYDATSAWAANPAPDQSSSMLAASTAARSVPIGSDASRRASTSKTTAPDGFGTVVSGASSASAGSPVPLTRRSVPRSIAATAPAAMATTSRKVAATPMATTRRSRRRRPDAPDLLSRSGALDRLLDPPLHREGCRP